MQKDRIKKILKIVVVIALFICIGLTNGKARKVTIIEDAFSSLVTLPQRLIVNVRHFFSEDKNEYFKSIEKLKNENSELKNEIESLNNKLIDYEALLAENETLKLHIGLEEAHPNYSVIIADVILTSSSNWSLVYTINKGEKDGIKPNMAVICKEGLVGYVDEVNAHTSKIITILDAGNAVSGRATRTRDTVVVKGNLDLASKNQMKLINIPIGVSLVTGDKIETSGVGGIYPKGIVIGKVIDYEQKSNPLENEAIIESYVAFEKLETVAIIQNPDLVEDK